MLRQNEVSVGHAWITKLAQPLKAAFSDGKGVS